MNEHTHQTGTDGLRSALADVEQQLGEGTLALSPEEVADLLVVGVRAAGLVLESDEPLPEGRATGSATATDVVNVCNWLLSAVDLEPFELGFWRNFSGALRTSTGR